MFEDETALAFNDINPQAPVHILVIPKKPLVGISGAHKDDEALLGHLFYVAARIAEQKGLKKGYRLVVNEGPHGQQSIRWLHVHILGGRQFNWPPG